MTSNKINQIDLLKYEPGGKYEVHSDHYTDSPRHLSIILNLNEEYEGGDLIFTDQKNFEVKRLPTKGTRYSIVAWLE
jgi:Rps23 Pro-64 3,4-dihydroxylase Tpa1-like proline 4-hydroxylase